LNYEKNTENIFQFFFANFFNFEKSLPNSRMPFIGQPDMTGKRPKCITILRVIAH
jgi:hypothetical protein